MITIPLLAAVVITLVVLGSTTNSPAATNKMVSHNHVNLNVTYNGKALMVPEHIGMVQIGKAEDLLLYGDHSLDQYGMEGMSPLHTHDTSGTIHVESSSNRALHLENF